LLEVERIDVYYGDLQVLWGVSFDVQEKEILAIVGSNGAGKSTILKTLAGLLRPARGKISFHGRRLEQLPPEGRVGLGICLVPEGRGLFPGMSILENLELGAYNRQARRLRAQTFRSVYELFPVLEKRKRQIAGSLSGGEQQMVAIARGLMSRPKLLLLDEPSLGLAPLLTKSIFEAIAEVNKSDVTVVLVEQNVQTSLDLANRAYIVESGRIVAHGAAESLSNDRRIKEAYLGMGER